MRENERMREKNTELCIHMHLLTRQSAGERDRDRERQTDRDNERDIKHATKAYICILTRQHAGERETEID